MGRKIDDLNPILSKITRPVAAINSLRFALILQDLDNSSLIFCKMGAKFISPAMWNDYINKSSDFFFSPLMVTSDGILTLIML